jgi:hypothetical protein
MIFHPLDPNGTEPTAADALAHLEQLEAERAHALRSQLAANVEYLAELDAELALCRHVHAVLAVTEIASLRAELSQPQAG